MKNKIIIIISVTLVILLMSSLLFLIKNDNPKITLTDDEIKFKNEYEKMNNVKVDDTVLNTTLIDDDNNVIYFSDTDMHDLMTKSTNIIFIGSSNNNVSRTIAPILVKFLKNNEIKKLYYYNTSIFETDGVDETIYNNINSIFNEKLKIQFSIYSSYVIFVKDGNVVGFYDSKDINSDEFDESDFKKQISDYIDQVSSGVCVSDIGC